MLLCTNQASLYCPPHPCSAHTIAMLLHDSCAIYDLSPTPLFVSHTLYTIGNGNAV